MLERERACAPGYFDVLAVSDGRRAARSTGRAGKQNFSTIHGGERVGALHEVSAIPFEVHSIPPYRGDGNLIPGCKRRGSQFVRDDVSKVSFGRVLRRLYRAQAGLKAKAGCQDNRHGSGCKKVRFHRGFD